MRQERTYKAIMTTIAVLMIIGLVWTVVVICREYGTGSESPEHSQEQMLESSDSEDAETVEVTLDLSNMYYSRFSQEPVALHMDYNEDFSVITVVLEDIVVFRVFRDGEQLWEWKNE